ncbi:MAG: TIGR02147 family protein [Pseudobdellovibrionaceae bacterium]|nr:TIGR02147 family protein [Pseudobdellovibrionaceae bacterium]
MRIISYTSYRTFFEDYIREHYTEKGKSFRAFSKRCGIASPNYFQQVMAFRKNMTVPTAEKVAAALHFSKQETEYLRLLVKLDMARDPNHRFDILEELQRIAARSKSTKIIDPSFHGHWLHQVIWSLAHTKNFQDDPLWIAKAIRYSASEEDIIKSLGFLKAKKFLLFDPGSNRWLAKWAHFETDNDIRNFDLQKNHNRFLKFAESRLSDPVHDREYQGLTIAIPKAKIALVKQQMREFVRHLNDVLGGSDNCDAVIRVEMAAFIVAEPKD